MERISRYCTNCGSELDEGAKFCAQCGSPTRQHDAPVAANESKGQPRKDNAPDVADEGSRQPRKNDAPAAADEARRRPRQDDAPAAAGVAGRQPRKDVAAVAVGEAWSGYRRFLRIDPSGGFFAIVTPLFIWTAAAGILTWAVLGLVSLRFDLSILNLEDLFFTMLIIIGIMLSVVANAYLVLSYRDRTGALGQVLRQLPMVWAAGLCVGLFIMIWQVWTDFAGGPNELRRAMFSLIGVGVCGMYSGYVSLVAIGPDRIYQVVRRVVYVLIAVIAVEVLDALWWGTRHLSGAEIGTHFVRAGWTALLVRCRVLHHRIFHGSSKSQETANQYARRIPRVRAVRIHDCRRGTVGHVSSWCDPIRAWSNRDSNRRDHWVVDGAALP